MELILPLKSCIFFTLKRKKKIAEALVGSNGVTGMEDMGITHLRIDFWPNQRDAQVIVEAMVLESILPSPRMIGRSTSIKRHFTKNEFGSCSALLQRHRFLLSAFTLLTILCTIYLYFAVTLGANDPCSGLSGTQKASCHMQQIKASISKGK
ncbi:hypothetical protein RJT34_04282 [Clitoria ternatea]|uniref:Uncharacterized protein n=1 Tax=Clitoria ternatea TaxID=43366 RepID=A0AAN9KL01_CLITE